MYFKLSKFQISIMFMIRKDNTTSEPFVKDIEVLIICLKEKVLFLKSFNKLSDTEESVKLQGKNIT